MPQRSAFEPVLTMTDFYDGPRAGIANFHGEPHFYESEWDDSADDYASSFRLTPILSDVLALALEDWAIWTRWETAFHQGRADHDSHPALPADRARHNELEQVSRDRLRTDPLNSRRVTAEFRNALDWDGTGPAPIEVRWQLC